jgi:hypothetical protein
VSAWLVVTCVIVARVALMDFAARAIGVPWKLHELAKERKDLGSRLLFARARLTVELRSSCQDSISVEQTITATHPPTVEGTFVWNS